MSIFALSPKAIETKITIKISEYYALRRLSEFLVFYGREERIDRESTGGRSPNIDPLRIKSSRSSKEIPVAQSKLAFVTKPLATMSELLPRYITH
jgi:hypothetical protein